MPSEDVCAAIAGHLSNLCKQHNSVANSSIADLLPSDSTEPKEIALPGPDSIAKKTLERELGALVSRVQVLEARALANDQIFSAPSAKIETHHPAFQHGLTTELRANSEQSELSHSSNKDSRTWLSKWLAHKDLSNGECQSQISPTKNDQPLSDEQLGRIRDYLNQQAEHIRHQREELESLSMQVDRQKKDADTAFGNGMEDIGTLKRELEKHQQANLAFQKALREIGSIVTAVANGDLSKKVLIHKKEMDPEIATFKRTINTMVDQLQDFASQVTHLAKEVGTEGRLGGQAELPGVAGKSIRIQIFGNGSFANYALRYLG